MDDAYDSYGITLKPWFVAKGTKSKQKSYNVIVVGWKEQRRVIETDGLISFQVTVHRPERCCWTCKERVSFVKQELADYNVQCFWTCDPDDGSLYVTVGPAPPQRPSADTYLSFILGLPVLAYSRRRRPRKQRQAKVASRKCHRIVH
jgi:hypothetical protein